MEFKISQLDRQLPTGAITTAHWTASKTSGDHTASVYGTQGFTPDSSSANFIAFPQVTEAQVVQWVQDAMGPETVAAIESSLDSQIAELQAPKTASGLPWAA